MDCSCHGTGSAMLLPLDWTFHGGQELRRTGYSSLHGQQAGRQGVHVAWTARRQAGKVCCSLGSRQAGRVCSSLGSRQAGRQGVQ